MIESDFGAERAGSRHGGLGGESCLTGKIVDGVAVGAVCGAEWCENGRGLAGELPEPWAQEPGVQAGEEQGVAEPCVGDLVVPIHSHDSTETFLVISDTKQALVPGDDGLERKDVHAGDYVQIAGGQAHAFRNVSAEPAIELIITNPRLGEWFSEAGRPVTGEPGPPTPDDLARLIAVSGKYGYRLGTPEENRAAGIHSWGEQDAPDATGIARRHFLPTPSSPITAQPEARPASPVP
jgi:mannose-6-phosphate isomerase-like protein (cupin superfamily)